jgi:hypothetical protein
MDRMTVLRIAFVIALVWVLAWLTGSAASVRVPGGYARIGKGKGRCRGSWRPRRYSQVATGMVGVNVCTTAPQAVPAGVPYSTF